MIHSSLRLIGVLLIFIFCVPDASAFFGENFPKTQQSRRNIRATTKYLNSLDRQDRIEGTPRRRSFYNQASRRDAVRRKGLQRGRRRSRTNPSHHLKKTMHVTPTLQKSRLSLVSKMPVSSMTNSFYKNGVKYVRGEDGVERNLIYAHMWFSFALSDGHPLARSALSIIERRMTAPQLAEASDRAKRFSKLYLKYPDRRETAIRDLVREDDLMLLAEGLNRFWYTHDGHYPDVIPFKATEICRRNAKTCYGLVDFGRLVPTHAITIPVDIDATPGWRGTGYFVEMLDDGTVVFSAPKAETRIVEVEY